MQKPKCINFNKTDYRLFSDYLLNTVIFFYDKPALKNIIYLNLL